MAFQIIQYDFDWVIAYIYIMYTILYAEHKNNFAM